MTPSDPAARLLAEAQQIAAKAWSRGEKPERWRIANRDFDPFAPPAHPPRFPHTRCEPLYVPSFDPAIVAAFRQMKPCGSCGRPVMAIVDAPDNVGYWIRCHCGRVVMTERIEDLADSWNSPPPSAGG